MTNPPTITEPWYARTKDCQWLAPLQGALMFVFIYEGKALWTATMFFFCVINCYRWGRYDAKPPTQGTP